jgi:hypothetical protein
LPETVAGEGDHAVHEIGFDEDAADESQNQIGLHGVLLLANNGESA